MGDGLRRCKACRSETSATAGTILAGTRTPLVSWFAAVWYVVGQKQGVSALGLQRVLGFGSYQTAWAWLHKLRRAMVRPGRELLDGIIEIDETILGGRSAWAWCIGQNAGRDRRRAPRGRSRAHADAPHPDASKDVLTEFVLDHLQRGSEVHTDGWGCEEHVDRFDEVGDAVEAAAADRFCR